MSSDLDTPPKGTIGDTLIVINAAGDIDLEVKSYTGTRVYRVSSHQLIACSKFFSKMLDRSSRFAESVAFKAHFEDPTTFNTPFALSINVEEKSQTEMITLLRIIHSQPHGLTSQSNKTVDRWHAIAELVDYLQCGDSLRDWASLWLSQSVDIMLDFPNIDKWIFIADVFRNEKVFEAVTRQAVLRMVTEEDSDEVFWQTNDLQNKPRWRPRNSNLSAKLMANFKTTDIFTETSPVVLSKLAETREILLHKLAKPMLDLEQYYRDYPGRTSIGTPVGFRCQKQMEGCDLLIYGAAQYWISRLGLIGWGRRSQSTLNKTINELVDQLSSITFPEWPELGVENNKSARLVFHTQCNPLKMDSFNMAKNAKKALDDLVSKRSELRQTDAWHE
ncbi:hypothetical protein EX30DRAFT_399393 [Ascodesmis nigricans]|uniref:Uncharacterized protein n=1 Tax=Ascodesmis nigricans TaxID=341454 RepID=A0A4S2MP39_9PEZI|nr:hypothetical protein EX30DRAFT_399393 [Ascodesmis nigricans]